MFRPILTLFLFSLALPNLRSQGWDLRYDKDGIQVHHRKSAHSSIDELKLITVVKSSMPALLEFLSDVKHFPIWVYRCAEAEEVERLTRAEGVYYSRMDFPWPLRDRDFYARSHALIQPGGKQVIIQVEGQPDYRPERDRVVRMPFLKVRWVLTEMSPGRVRIEYFLHADPGGSLPDWMVNMALDKGPSETMQNIRTELARYTESRNTRQTDATVMGTSRPQE